MAADWITSPSARRVLAHWADQRPAWLWSADGEALLWRNPAARLFNARIKKGEVRPVDNATPIRGQVARILRLGVPGRASLSRVQFLSGRRPLSATCTCTPLKLENGDAALLIVGVDPIAPDLAAPLEPSDSLAEALLPAGTRHVLVDAKGEILAGAQDLESFVHEAKDLPDGAHTEITRQGARHVLDRLRAGPAGESLLLVREIEAPADSAIAEARHEEGLDILSSSGEEPEPVSVPEEPEPEPDVSPDIDTLASLFDRLAEADDLYAPIADSDVEPTPDEPAAPDQQNEDDIAAIIAFAEDLEELHETGVSAPASDTPSEDATPPDAGETPLFRVVGRRFHPLAATPPAEMPADLERVSRYNFDELSRILNDRVAGEETEPPLLPPEALYAVAPPPPTPPSGEGALINLAGETFILNRLPLGIMVFRDQQVLFANRALIDMTGHESIEKLRQDGIEAIFPADGQPRDSAEAVTHLTRRDGTLLPVTARLQSISWQGKPALMLSAGMAERRQSHEAAVKTFAELAAQAQGEGFVATDRAGIVTHLADTARSALGDRIEDGVGGSISGLLAPEEGPALQAFLELPARFAETRRPYCVLKSVRPGVEITLFPEGQAGIVAGYFGFVRRKPGRPAPIAMRGEDEIEPSMLARVSRGIRRPLNTIIGFSDLIRSSTIGTGDADRSMEYARDIRVAGHEIAALVEELDDYARLKDGRYTVRPSDVDLTGLLESCVVRVRGQANAARVLVRSAISERLPHIRVDRASLGQAVLNLLASAIDQTPPGGSVIISAQFEDDGSIGVHVRDSGSAGVDLGERFVVFRDGIGRDGEALAPVRSSVGLALTRSLLAVNTCSLSVDPSAGVGTIFSLMIPPELVVMGAEAPQG
ncbi:sensor histidine kinase [Arsenicitalea aurantiaca]|nr:HAMP domain-containing sensor histidine kinase [Arsenicitalea aurantiaca]